ncbi:MAG: glycogen debranching protein [Bacteroidota bacterium]|nr:glycogen debranching protein [Bacteroidota bacterium]
MACFSAMSQEKKSVIYKSDKFTVYSNSVIQPPYKAVSLSPNQLISNYQGIISPTIKFKFSINGNDNEADHGIDHMVTIRPQNGTYVSKLIKFGVQSVDTMATKVDEILKPETKWIVRLDMRDVLKSFKGKGFFTLFNGEKIYQKDFKGVYIAGSIAPLTWKFENLNGKKEFELKDENHDGIYEATLILNPHPAYSSWKLTSDLTLFPKYKSNLPLVDALYNLSVEEMLKDVRSDGAFIAGEVWNGVWTRDISYSIDLALAIINPEASKISLMKKVQNKKIIQDTGTGGSWPVSTDRVVWSLAAWEVYKVTGDKEWLANAFQIIKNTTDDDKLTILNKETGMYFGESSFMDWREQTYPVWMGPIDIFNSQNLGTNAVHFQTYQILSLMAKELKLPDVEIKATSDKIRDGINRYLWMKDKGYYAQYLYGKNYQIISKRSDALGEALCVLFDIANPAQQKQIIANTPVTEFGTPCIFPQVPNTFSYHNNAVWPFVQAYWALAAAKIGNEKAVLQSIATIYRVAALALSNRENLVATTGDYKTTAGSSPRQLWSVAGNLSMVFKLYYGMDFQPAGIRFKPLVPQTIAGNKTLSNFKYRDAVLNIQMKGFGNTIKSFLIDGKKMKEPFIAADLKGNHSVVIELNNHFSDAGTINFKDVDFSLPALTWQQAGDSVILRKDSKIRKYIGYKNGMQFIETTNNRIRLANDGKYTEYMFKAIDDNGYETFSDKPLIVLPNERVWRIEAEQYAEKANYNATGFTGDGYIELSKTQNTNYPFQISVPEEGDYSIDFRYANGSGPIYSENKCAIRTLFNDAINAGAVVFPQCGDENGWSKWGYSNAVKVHLSKGNHHFYLRFVPNVNDNMNLEVNTAILDAIQIFRIH